MRHNRRVSIINLEWLISNLWSFYTFSEVRHVNFKLGWMTYHDRITCECEEKFNFNLCQCYKTSSANSSFIWSEWFLRIFQSQLFFLCWWLCFLCSLCFCCQKSSKLSLQVWKKWTTWLVETWKYGNLRKLQFRIEIFRSWVIKIVSRNWRSFRRLVHEIFFRSFVHNLTVLLGFQKVY